MPTPAIVVFDLGKVLVDFDYGIAARQIAARGTMPAAAIQHMIDHSPLLFRFETGRISKEQFFDEVQATTGFRGDLTAFARLFSDIFTPMPEMVQLHAELRARGLPTYIFSNTNELAVGHIRKQFPFFSEFDGYIYSYEHGAMKPEARLYEVVESQTGRRGKDVFYIDDRPENIAAGAARGWQTILQESSKKTRAALEEAGLLKANVSDGSTASRS